MRLVAMTSASNPSIAINATQRAIRARIAPCMARPPSLAAPQRTIAIPSIFGGKIGTGMRRVPAEFVEVRRVAANIAKLPELLPR
jgi:hypothetical protein